MNVLFRFVLYICALSFISQMEINGNQTKCYFLVPTRWNPPRVIFVLFCSSSISVGYLAINGQQTCEFKLFLLRLSTRNVCSHLFAAGQLGQYDFGCERCILISSLGREEIENMSSPLPMITLVDVATNLWFCCHFVLFLYYGLTWFATEQWLFWMLY